MSEQTTSPEPESTPAADGAQPRDDHGAALERSADAIDQAREAQAPVAANDDITTRDADRAGEHSEDPGGEGGHP